MKATTKQERGTLSESLEAKKTLLDDLMEILYSEVPHDPLEGILWVGTKDGLYQIPWDDFSELCQGMTFQEVQDKFRTDIVVRGETWWLSWDYDHADCEFAWGYHELPEINYDAEELSSIRNR